jgi:exodeoxyribonuclease V alpha subunit
MITATASQNYSMHLVNLLARKCSVRLDDDELAGAAGVVLKLLEAEESGETHIRLDELELNPGMLRVLGTHPLVIENNCIFSARTHAALAGVWQWFNAKLQENKAIPNGGPDDGLRFVPPDLENVTLRLGSEDQLPAVLKAARFPFSVITGGPGTGKTTIIAACLAELLLRNTDLAPGQIALCAPTGKAAHRLKEGLDLFVGKHLGSALPGLKNRMQEIPKAKTLHKLLGASQTRALPLEGSISKIPAKVVVLDECSMVGAELMCALMKSLSEDARLVLVGDADQLPAVECGSVFRDMVAELEKVNSANIQRLLHSRRSVREIVEEAGKALRNGADADFEWRPLARGEALAERPVRFVDGVEGIGAKAKHDEWMQTVLSRIFSRFANEHNSLAGEGGLSAFKIIAPRREGTTGIVEINRQMHELARTHWKIRRSGFLVGEPVMVMENIHHLDLFNGDVGIVVPRPSDVVFPDLERCERYVLFKRSGEDFTVPLDQLTGRVELAWASTCHKAQGSEYQHVFVFLPDESQSMMKSVTNNWFYTAMTRAKATVTVFRMQK